MMPAYFDELHLREEWPLVRQHVGRWQRWQRIESTIEAREAWIKWRDNELTHQFMSYSYRRSVSFWISSPDSDRRACPLSCCLARLAG